MAKHINCADDALGQSVQHQWCLQTLTIAITILRTVQYRKELHQWNLHNVFIAA